MLCSRYYSLFTLGMLVMFECTVVGQRIRNINELRSLQTPKQGIQVYRNGRWDSLPGEALAPGDVISIGRPSGAGPQEQIAFILGSSTHALQLRRTDTCYVGTRG